MPLFRLFFFFFFFIFFFHFAFHLRHYFSFRYFRNFFDFFYFLLLILLFSLLLLFISHFLSASITSFSLIDVSFAFLFLLISILWLWLIDYDVSWFHWFSFRISSISIFITLLLYVLFLRLLSSMIFIISFDVASLFSSIIIDYFHFLLFYVSFLCWFELSITISFFSLAFIIDYFIEFSSLFSL